MAAEGRELGWEDSIKQDAQDYEPIPEGDYNVTIEKFDRSRSKGEGKLPPCNMAVVYFTVHVPEREVTIRENYVLHTSLEWKLSDKTARAKIGLKPGIKDPNKKFNYIEKLYPKDTSKPAFTPGGF